MATSLICPSSRSRRVRTPCVPCLIQREERYARSAFPTGHLVVVAMLMAWGLFQPGECLAHPGHASRATLVLASDDTYQLYCTFDVAACVMQAPPGMLGEELEQELRELSDEKLNRWIGEARSVFQRRLKIWFDGQEVEPLLVEFPDAKKLRSDELRDGFRPPRVVLVLGRAPRGAQQVMLRLPLDLGQVALTVQRADDTALLYSVGEEQTTPEIPLHGENVLLHFLRLGFEHIVPKGLDHILFVLGLFLLSPRLKPLLWQVTAFTLAHSVTLALSMLDIVRLSPQVVEPLIALSIVVVAIENILTSELHRWRLLIVFAFGLLHGLGFAGVLTEAGMSADRFVAALVSFNVGVELGQLAVIALAWLAVGWFQQRAWYRSWVVIPASSAIALLALYWTWQRLSGG